MTHTALTRLLAWSDHLWLIFCFLTWLILTDDERDYLREEFSKS